MGFFERGYEPYPLDDLDDQDIRELGVDGLREMGVSEEDIASLSSQGLVSTQEQPPYYHRLSREENEQIAKNQEERDEFRELIEIAKRPNYDKGKVALELRYNEWIAIFDTLSSELREKLSKALEKSGKERGVALYVRESSLVTKRKKNLGRK